MRGIVGFAPVSEPLGDAPDPPLGTGLHVIDVRHLGRERAITAFVQDDVLVDPGPESASATLLAALGDWRPRAILLTHIHLDHASATGALLERWPDTEVWVHERGARHLTDPSKLIASATRLYGEDMDRLWGRIVPVPEARLRVLGDEETIGPWRVAYTPGHASHHVCYLHEPSGTAFTGDVAGVRIAGGPTIPPTPPPDIDLEAWAASLALVAAWTPRRLAITHSGVHEDAQAQLDEVGERLARWGALARDLDAEAFARQTGEELRRAVTDPALAATFTQASPPSSTWPGLRRYWDKRAEREAGAAAAGPS